MISSRRHRRGEAAKDGLTIVLNRTGFAVHQMPGANYLPAEGRTNGLVSKANSEQRHFILILILILITILAPGRKMANQFDADAGFLRSAWSGGDDNSLGVHRLDLLNANFVIAANLDLSAEFAQVLDKVVGKRIVIVEDEDHVSIVDG